MSQKSPRKLKPIYKNGIIIVILAIAFISSTLLAIDASVNLSVPVQNSNRTLNDWKDTLQAKGYSIYFTDFKASSNMVKIETITQFENALKDHQKQEAYFQWTQLAFPFTIQFGKIWFVDEGTTYYIETYW
jgi:Na+-transporting NADH:ubiquinone oxidoreductase subunit NqrC